MDNPNQVGYPKGYYVEGEDEQHHEKKSVLKKVKAKAKKLKDTITKHGHGHNRDHDHPEGHIPDDHDLDEEDDDDEEIVEDPEIHGAPIYDSAAVRTGVFGQPEDLNRPGVAHDRLKATPLNPVAPRENVGTFNSGNYNTQGNYDHPTKSSIPGLVTEQPRVNFGKTTDITEAPKAPQNTPAPSFHGAPIHESGVASERLKPTPLQDPIVPRENVGIFNSGDYETQGNYDYDHPTRSTVNPLQTEQPKVNFGKTTDFVEAPKAPQNTPVPSFQRTEEDASSPTQTFVHGQEGYHSGQPKVNLQRPQGLEKDPAAPKDIFEPYSTTNYQTKVTDPTGKGGEATGITPILHSLDKMKIHDNEQDKGRERNSGTDHHQASDLTFPTGSHDQFSPEPTPPEPLKNAPLDSETAEDDEYSLNLASEKPSSQSSYTEKISSTTSAIADKAVSAKNVVASKLGYGEKDQTPAANEYNEGQDDTTKQTSVADYGKKMAATVTGTLTPVYEKVAEAGSTVMSKLHGPGGTGTASEVAGTETDHVPEQDKGVTMKGYIVEKLRPGEEDKALSEAISDVLHKQKDPEIETGSRPRGKLIESEETVTVVHAPGDDERDGNIPTNGGVVDKIKGTVGSWFGKGDQESQGTPQPQPHDSSYGNEDFASYEGKPRLQESGN